MLTQRIACLPVWVSGVEQTLLIEWPNGEGKLTDYSFVYGHDGATTKQMVRILKQRWRTERVYQDMKGELGLDHFEGRSYSGWNHHVTLALCCYALVVAEQLRLFPSPPEGHVGTSRSRLRPERHFAASFITARIMLARALTRWLPSCPWCGRDKPRRC